MGAIFIAGQLRDAEIEPAMVFRLIPLEQLLVTGIQQLFIYAVLASIVLLLLFIGMEMEYTKPANPDKSKASRPEPAQKTAKDASWFPRFLLWLYNHHLWWTLQVLPYVVLLAALLFTTWNQAIWLILIWVIQGLWVRGRLRFLSYLFVTGVALLIWSAGVAFFNPTSLPSAAITQWDGSTDRGQLITQANGTWYLATGEREYRAFSEQRIRSVVISSDEPENPPFVVETLLGRRFL